MRVRVPVGRGKADIAGTAAREWVSVRVDKRQGWGRKNHFLPSEEGCTGRLLFVGKGIVAPALHAPSYDEEGS
jgi:hypothetical protein